MADSINKNNGGVSGGAALGHSARRLSMEEITAAFEEYIKDDLERQNQMANGMMKPSFVGADPEGMSVTLHFPVLPWELNRVGTLHGGVMATMLDHTLGLAANCYVGSWAPTLSLNVDYIRPAHLGDEILATATVVFIGRRVVRMRGQLILQGTGKLVASCSASFFNKEG